MKIAIMGGWRFITVEEQIPVIHYSVYFWTWMNHGKSSGALNCRFFGLQKNLKPTGFSGTSFSLTEL